MVMEKCVDLIMPVYNSQNNLSETINSVVQQTYKNWRLIIVDDGSKDNSGKICDDYAKVDSRIVVIHTVNRGVSAARNTGLSYIKSEFVMFVDSDDKLYDRCIEIALKNIKNEDLLIYGYLLMPGRIKQSINEIKCYNSHIELGVDYRELSEKHLLNSPWNKLYRSSIIQNNSLKFQEGLSLGEDLLFNLSFLEMASAIKVIPDVLYEYRNDNQGSLSNKLRENAVDIQKMIRAQLINTFSDQENVRFNSSIVFAKFTIEEMKAIVYSKKFSVDKKKEFIKKWLHDSAFCEAIELVGLKIVAPNPIDYTAISRGNVNLLYLSYKMRGIISRMIHR